MNNGEKKLFKKIFCLKNAEKNTNIWFTYDINNWSPENSTKQYGVKTGRLSGFSLKENSKTFNSNLFHEVFR